MLLLAVSIVLVSQIPPVFYTYVSIQHGGRELTPQNAALFAHYGLETGLLLSVLRSTFSYALIASLAYTPYFLAMRGPNSRKHLLLMLALAGFLAYWILTFGWFFLTDGYEDVVRLVPYLGIPTFPGAATFDSLGSVLLGSSIAFGVGFSIWLRLTVEEIWKYYESWRAYS